jgi:RNA polymerase sigma-70 factor (ECF subfamily)
MHLVSAQLLERSNTLSDVDVVRRVVDGETALFEVLMRRHNERVYRAARAIVRDEAEAEDVMQQAYVSAYANLRQFHGAAQFSTWLTRIAINEAIARVRRKGRYDPLDEDRLGAEEPMFERLAQNPEQQAFAGELHRLLERAIDQLPDGMRAVFMLRDVEGMSTAETATAMGVSEDVIKTRLSRARMRLRRMLLDQAGADTPGVFPFFRPRCDRVVDQVMARITSPTP